MPNPGSPEYARGKVFDAGFLLAMGSTVPGALSLVSATVRHLNGEIVGIGRPSEILIAALGAASAAGTVGGFALMETGETRHAGQQGQTVVESSGYAQASV